MEQRKNAYQKLFKDGSIYQLDPSTREKILTELHDGVLSAAKMQEFQTKAFNLLEDNKWGSFNAELKKIEKDETLTGDDKALLLRSLKYRYIDQDGKDEADWLKLVNDQSIIITPDNFTATAGEEAKGNVMANDTDGFKAELVGTLDGLTLNQDGSFSLKILEDASTPISFKYKIKKDDGTEAGPVTVTITVKPKKETD